jgi:hypothetical protein
MSPRKREEISGEGKTVLVRLHPDDAVWLDSKRLVEREPRADVFHRLRQQIDRLALEVPA